jgi:hypothetical protein
MTFKRSVPARMMIARDTGCCTSEGLPRRTWRQRVDPILELVDELAPARLRFYTKYTRLWACRKRLSQV